MTRTRMASLSSIPIRKNEQSANIVCDFSDKCPLWLFPVCIQWLALETQSPVRPHLDIVSFTLHGVVPNHLPTLD